VITEGKFHQVKRMLQAVDNEVLYLKRIRMGNLVLDETLPKGSYRRLSEGELEALKNLGRQ
jgi:16S rRNA pseudouridine516 synthase